MYKSRAFLPRAAKSLNPDPSRKPRKLCVEEQQFLNFAKTIPKAENVTSGLPKFVGFDHDVPPADYMVKCIQDNECPDVIVTVNGRMFPCHRLVLSIYSKRMLKLLAGDVRNIVFEKEDLTPKAFSDAYQWMISTRGELNTCDMVDILRAAYFLDIPELLEACWITLDSPVVDELSAFNIMYEARAATNMPEVFDKLAGRLNKATLPAASSMEFLSLSEVQICSILKSSTLAVNSEMELLYCALMWLSHCWPQRRSSTNVVLKHIRFGYLPPTMLSKFRTKERNQVGHFGEILEEFSKSPDINQLVRDGLFDSSLIIAVYNDPNVVEENVEFKQVKLTDPRCWIRDHLCEYHRNVTTLCPNMRYITPDQFEKYLMCLSRSRLEYPDYETEEESESDWEMKREIKKLMLLKSVVGMDADLDRQINLIRQKRSDRNQDPKTQIVQA
ncbi:kelch-like protein 4 [Drosophila santomea]|uniref:kelch-like protein 4 n=1 Tax=Drosophila santomea TaxID=129105 RepID=UPI0019543D3C|nr:kelch-like protein 4 [Drosophila santomea]XP_039497019.1 kelch-like protein 4 [Drosophila santomea]